MDCTPAVSSKFSGFLAFIVLMFEAGSLFFSSEGESAPFFTFMKIAWAMLAASGRAGKCAEGAW
jgi:hypothetical protein